MEVEEILLVKSKSSDAGDSIRETNMKWSKINNHVEYESAKRSDWDWD